MHNNFIQLTKIIILYYNIYILLLKLKESRTVN